ncbi:MAG: methyltransferase domain-containing protein, partial [Flavobacteriales bacterium]|nr:methyltransferase domain-containing protein [Flavobacteriales bacterium]
MTEKKPLILSTEEGYDRWSEIYDTNKNPLTALDELVFFDNFPTGISGLEIADLGCGTGRVSNMLAKKGALVNGIDGSEGMLAKAAAHSDKTISYQHHNFSSPLPLESNLFDHVVSCLVLEHIEDLHLFFSEANRICKPGGLVYLTAMHPGMMLLGNEANFTDPITGEEVRPKGYAHQLADFVNGIKVAGLELV